MSIEEVGGKYQCEVAAGDEERQGGVGHEAVVEIAQTRQSPTSPHRI